MFVVPSQIGSTCASRSRRGIGALLDVAVAADQLHRLGHARHGELARHGLHDRREDAQQPRGLGVAGVGAPEGIDRFERQQQRADVLRLEVEERLLRERPLDDRPSERLPPLDVMARLEHRASDHARPRRRRCRGARG